MDWIAFSYSLPLKEGSSPRVALWRRLRRLGALSISGGLQILPAREECLEAFQWLAQEIRANNGEAAVMRVTQLEGLTDQELIDLFCAARAEDYRHIETHANELKQAVAAGKDTERSGAREGLARLRRRFADIARIDYFDCAEGKRVGSLLDTIDETLSPATPVTVPVPRADITQYRQKTWVTRPHPYVDRLACAWLIRRFVNPDAEIRYSSAPREGEVRFDMESGEFGHRGNLCTFEVMRLAFGPDDQPLRAIGEIVHEIDLHDGRYGWPETAGVETIIKGYSRAHLSDAELEAKGISLFEALYDALSQKR